MKNCIFANSQIQNILKIVKSLNEKFPNLSITFIETTIVFEEIWLPESRFKGLTLDILNAWLGPMYAFYASSCNL